MFDNLRNFLKKKLILTDQELAYLELLKVELSKETTIKCTPVIGPWYVVNTEDQMTFRIGSGTVVFAGPCGTAQFMCSLEVSDKFRQTIEERIVKEANVLEEELKVQELKVFAINEESTHQA